MGLCREDRAKWRGRSRDYVATMQSKERIYQRVFNTKGPRPTGHPPSYFLEADIMSVMSDEFPDTQTLRDYDLSMIQTSVFRHLQMYRTTYC